MRRLFFLAALAGLVWWVRDRIVPPPQLPAGAPPPFRHAPPPSASPTAPTPGAAGDDLTRVKGIGPVYRSRLAAEGITTFAGLAVADPGAVAEAIDVAASRIEDWQGQARSLI